MEFKEMTVEQLEERKAAIPAELDNEDADLNALEEEVRGINAELEERKVAEEKKVEIREAVAAGQGTVVEQVKVEEVKKMDINEIRNSKDYINAYAEYIKTNDPAECRALLTENVSGTVPVPEMVYDIVKTAWQREGIMSRVRKARLLIFAVKRSCSTSMMNWLTESQRRRLICSWQRLRLVAQFRLQLARLSRLSLLHLHLSELSRLLWLHCPMTLQIRQS